MVIADLHTHEHPTMSLSPQIHDWNSQPNCTGIQVGAMSLEQFMDNLHCV